MIEDYSAEREGVTEKRAKGSLPSPPSLLCLSWPKSQFVFPLIGSLNVVAEQNALVQLPSSPNFGLVTHLCGLNETHCSTQTNKHVYTHYIRKRQRHTHKHTQTETARLKEKKLEMFQSIKKKIISAVSLLTCFKLHFPLDWEESVRAKVLCNLAICGSIYKLLCIAYVRDRRH